MKPLTSEELKKLKDGDWVWYEDLISKRKKYLEVREKIDPVTMREYLVLGNLPRFFPNYKEYNKTWILYKEVE